MEICIRDEAGYELAIEGMAFSHAQECSFAEFPARCTEKYAKRADILASKDLGHNKFLESIIVWFDMRMPLYFWKQFDTYRVGVTKQSKSTMHTLMKRELTKDDFCYNVSDRRLSYWNNLIAINDFDTIIKDLSSGYLQTRRVCMSYKSIRAIIKQRMNHKLPEWDYFCSYMRNNLEYPELLGSDIW